MLGEELFAANYFKPPYVHETKVWKLTLKQPPHSNIELLTGHYAYPSTTLFFPFSFAAHHVKSIHLNEDFGKCSFHCHSVLRVNTLV